MSKSSKKYKQLDICAALRGKEEFYEDSEEVDSNIEKKKGLSPFDFSKDILFNKIGNLMNNADAENSFNPYMVLRVLSMYDDPGDDALPIAAMFDKYQAVLSKKQIYFGLLNTISKHRSGFRPFIKHKKDLVLLETSIVATHFKCSQKEAAEYCQIMGKAWVDVIKTKCGDFIEGDENE